MPDLPDLPALAETAVLVVVLLAPGLAVTYLLGLRGIAAWALAGPSTVTVVAVGGIAAPILGLRWTPAALVGSALLAAAAAAVAGRLLARAGHRRLHTDPRGTIRGAI